MSPSVDQGLLDALPDPVLLLQAIRSDDRDGSSSTGAVVDLICTAMNRAAARYLDRATDDVVGRSVADLLPGWQATRLLPPVGEVLATGRRHFIDSLEVHHPDAAPTFCEVNIAPWGQEIALTWRDVTDLVAARDRTAEAEARYRIMAEYTHDTVLSIDSRDAIQWVSPGVVRMLGYRPADLIGRVASLLVNPHDLPILRPAEKHARTGAVATCRIRLRANSGEDRWSEVTLRGLVNRAGDYLGGVVALRDIHSEVLAMEALRHEATTDTLTGLAKRDIALHRIATQLNQAEGEWYLICLGIDSLKIVNDAFTYSGGDTVLATVARRLVEAAGSEDHVARVAGDEFAITCPDLTTRDEAAAMAERLLDAVHGPVDVAGGRVVVTACAGIAWSTADISADALLRDASAAMRQAARKGPDRWEFLDGDVGADTLHALAVHEGLTDALEAGQVRPWLMPIVSLSDRSVIGYEALARWVHRDGRTDLPEYFLPVAERSRLILALDRFMIAATMGIMPSLADGVSVAINLSAATLESSGLTELLLGEVERTGADPHRIHLEVTETDLFRATDTVRAAMHRIADTGFTWWIDDFGTGFSPISHLRDLPITGLKLDQSFTREVTVMGSRAGQLAQGLAGLARGLGLVTVAEGIESEDQAKMLATQGWELGQGWLFGKAAPIPTGIPAQQ